jgi:Uncharacterized conserved protein (COG2071)
VNFRVDPAVMQCLLPAPFRPKLHAGYAIAGICLIRLEQIRPKGLPPFMGVASENAAHRIAVLWEDPSGETREGVYIPRRDTNSLLNHLAGGRIFPGEHQHADFDVTDNGSQISMSIRARDGGRMSTHSRAHPASAALRNRPPSSKLGASATPPRQTAAGSMESDLRHSHGKFARWPWNMSNRATSRTSRCSPPAASPSIMRSSCATCGTNGIELVI